MRHFLLQSVYKVDYELVFHTEIYWNVKKIKNESKNEISVFLSCRVGPDIRPFSISDRIPDIETIRIPDIRLIFNAGYLVIFRISNNGQISGRNWISGIRNQPDIRYPAKKLSGPTLLSWSQSYVKYKVFIYFNVP